MEASSYNLNMTPRKVEAGELFFGMPEASRSYAAVAEAMGGITEGRVRVYVKEYALANGREAELPQRGQDGNGGGTRSTAGRKRNAPTVSSATEQLEALYKQNEATRRTLEAQVQEAAQEAAVFSPEQAVQAHTLSLTQRVQAAQEALNAFTGEAAEQWAAQEAKRVQGNADTVREQNAEALSKLEGTLAGLRVALEATGEWSAERQAEAEAEAEAEAQANAEAAKNAEAEGSTEEQPEEEQPEEEQPKPKRTRTRS